MTEFLETLEKPFRKSYSNLLDDLRNRKEFDSTELLDKALGELIQNKGDVINQRGEKLVVSVIESARIAVEEIGLGRTSVSSMFVYHSLEPGFNDFTSIEKKYNKSIATISEGLVRISSINEEAVSSQAENFRLLLLNLAKDVRVIFIRLAEQLELMREMKSMTEQDQLQIASEAAYLYAPLAHRLGLYLIKSEMEDLSLKYTNRETYNTIAHKLAETMRARKTFIKQFIQPIKKELEHQDFVFEIKGRPKSIHSIWNKMKRKQTDFENIYDLFAIRIVIKSELKNEKADCWQVYSTVTDLYQPNPLRLRDWISVPKSNGYESLHTTVVGPEGRWVEVQIRTERMNEIAEKGVAAHWKYKGQEGKQGIDEWLARIRDILETPDARTDDFIDDIKLSLYSREVFVFTPKGDVKKFPEGATVLDFAYDIHTDVGKMCTGAKIGGKAVPIRHKLQNGDKIEILTSKNQKPTLDWLNFAVTSKAQKKIRQLLNEQQVKDAEHGKEIVKRRFKNWKIDYNDEVIRRLLKKYKLPNAQELYCMVSTEKIDLAEIKEFITSDEEVVESEVKTIQDLKSTKKNEVSVEDKADNYLVIDEKVVNIDYKLSPCCNPIMGDNVFGFVTINEGIKIHRTNCPNAVQLIGKYGYRVVNAKWTRRGPESIFPVNIQISGEDSPGILNRISEVIAKDLKVSVRSINLDTDNGIFKGTISLRVRDIEHLDYLISRLKEVKGVYTVGRVESNL